MPRPVRARAWNPGQLVGSPRRKYGNEPTVVNGIRFASKREAERYQTLAVKAMLGEIINLRLQSRWRLEVNGITVGQYVSDFDYQPVLPAAPPGLVRLGELVVEDAKGVRTPLYKLKRALMKACYGIDVVEV